MPGPLRSHRAEAKYNVTTEFPHLGLHSAAANGNLGLVKYALSHGQPINSVLDGVLPLHAACSGGNEMIVRYLIENGADVNAPRLPRRYSPSSHHNDNRTIVGYSGSTPLHFAAANGHVNIVHILLQHGAHPDLTDKRGVTPEMVALQAGFGKVAEVVGRWRQERDKDLVEREVVGVGAGDAGNQGMSQEGEGSKRLRMKRSVEGLLNTVKASTSSSSSPAPSHHHSHTNSSSTIQLPVTNSPRHFVSELTPPANGESSSPAEFPAFPPRRPSLPHIYDQNPSSPLASRTSSGSGSCPAKKFRRPSSAGSSADSAHPGSLSATPGGRRRLGTKYSLLSLFRKASGEPVDGGGSSPSIRTLAHSSSSNNLNLNLGLGSSHLTAEPSSMAIPIGKSASLDYSMDSPGSPSHRAGGSAAYRARLGSEPVAAGRLQRPSLRELKGVGSREGLNSNYSSESQRTRSGSGSGSSARPGMGVMKSHSRTPSGGRGQSQGLSPSGPRSNSRGRWHSPSPARGGAVLRYAGSLTSLQDEEYVMSPRKGHRHIEEEEEEEEEYGQVIRRRMGEEEGGLDVVPEMIGGGGGGLKLSVGGGGAQARRRGQSITSSPSLSPIMSPEEVLATPGNSMTEFPFGVPKTPGDSKPQQEEERKRDNSRLRGDSVSSTSSGGPSLHLYSTSSASESASNGVDTPAVAYAIGLPSTNPKEGQGVDSKGGSPYVLSEDDEEEFGLVGRRTKRRYQIPLGIDIRSISSHAQAEALVQQHQKSILDMDLGAVGQGEGMDRTPLSARLAAYGASLALERRLKEKEEAGREREREKKEGRFKVEVTVAEGEDGGYVYQPMRQGSRKGGQQVVKAKKVVRRPHTSGGESSSVHGHEVDASPPRGLARSTSVRVPAHTQDEREGLEPGGGIQIFEIAATPVDNTLPHLHGHQHQLSDPSAYTPVRIRSRTPDPEPENDTFSLGEASTTTGAPLSRVSTAPAQDTLNDLLPGSLKNRRDQNARHIASANKLTRMGFANSAAAEAWGGGGSTSPRHGAGGKRFGGLKSFVQSLKGKA